MHLYKHVPGYCMVYAYVYAYIYICTCICLAFSARGRRLRLMATVRDMSLDLRCVFAEFRLRPKDLNFTKDRGTE